MKFWKLMPIMLFVGVLAAATFAFAAPLSVDSDDVSAGGDVIGSCDDEIEAVIRGDWEDNEGFEVKFIKLFGVNTDCEDGRFTIVLTEKGTPDFPGVELCTWGEGTVPASNPTGVQITIPVASTDCEGVLVEDVDDIHVMIRDES